MTSWHLIQSDQDAIIRADAHGPLVVEGGPGTGKSVVAFIGPPISCMRIAESNTPAASSSLARANLSCDTSRTFFPDWEKTVSRWHLCVNLFLRIHRFLLRIQSAVAALKASMSMVRAVDAAVRLYEELFTSEHEVSTPWGDATVTAQMWRAARIRNTGNAPQRGTGRGARRTGPRAFRRFLLEGPKRRIL